MSSIVEAEERSHLVIKDFLGYCQFWLHYCLLYGKLQQLCTNTDNINKGSLLLLYFPSRYSISGKERRRKNNGESFSFADAGMRNFLIKFSQKATSRMSGEVANCKYANQKVRTLVHTSFCLFEDDRFSFGNIICYPYLQSKCKVWIFSPLTVVLLSTGEKKIIKRLV